MAEEATGAAAPENDFVTTTYEAQKPTEAQPEPKPEQVAKPEDNASGDVAKPEEGEKKPRQPNPFQERIDKLTKSWREEERKRQELEERVRLYEQTAKPTAEEPASGNKAPTSEELQKLVEAKAQEVVTQRQYNDRVQNWFKGGVKEYGQDDFNDKCNTVANLGAADRPEFMQIVTDPEIVPDGHKLVAALADDPHEAMRILAMPAVTMAAALAKYADKIGKTPAKAISKAPEPFKPVDGTANVNDEPSEKDSEEDWFRKRGAQKLEQAKLRMGSGAKF